MIGIIAALEDKKVAYIETKEKTPSMEMKNEQAKMETKEKPKDTMEEEPIADTQCDAEEEEEAESIPETETSKGNEVKKPDDGLSKSMDLLEQVNADLQTRAAAGPADEDLRRAQLQMRASEKEKQEEEREQQKAKKAEKAEKIPKAKGRPRKIPGEPVPKKQRKSKAAQATAEENPGEEAMDDAEHDDEVEPNEENAQKKRKNSKKDQKPKAKAKAKAKADAKRPPRPRRKEASPAADPKMVQDMVDLLIKYKDVPYDKDNETYHKVYTKGKSPLWVSIYFGRPAGGVKIQEGEKESQKFYFSYLHSTVAVHIYMCNSMCEKFFEMAANNVEAWWDREDAMHHFRQLIVSGGAAQKIFEEKFNKSG